MKSLPDDSLIILRDTAANFYLLWAHLFDGIFFTLLLTSRALHLYNTQHQA